MLFRSGVIVALYTFLSRILGLIRELFIASIFGTNYIADSVNVAFKLPNLFRRIFAEGAVSVVFIPIFNQKLLNSVSCARSFTGQIFTVLVLALLLFVVTVEIFMPSIVMLIAPGFKSDAQKFELTIILCRITMPYIIFISIVALCGSVLNSVKKFAAFAFSPIILSVIIIICTLTLQSKITPAVAISVSVLIGGMLQLLFMYYCVWRAKLTFKVNISTTDPDVKLFLYNMCPAVLSAGAHQLNLFISQSIASFIPGAVSILSYADRIYQFPLSIIGVTFATVLLPELSRRYKMCELEKAYELQNQGIKAGLFLSLPASIGIILLSCPIIHIIYEYGAFTRFDTVRTAQALSAFALGLPAFVLSKILTSIFYANSDTKTPLRVAIYVVSANTALNVILMFGFEHTGIAIGSSISAWYGVWLLCSYGKIYNIRIFSAEIKQFILKLIVCCVVMILGILVIINFYDANFYSNSILIKSITLIITVFVGALIFFITSILTGIYTQFIAGFNINGKKHQFVK